MDWGTSTRSLLVINSKSLSMHVSQLMEISWHPSSCILENIWEIFDSTSSLKQSLQQMNQDGWTKESSVSGSNASINISRSTRLSIQSFYSLIVISHIFHYFHHDFVKKTRWDEIAVRDKARNAFKKAGIFHLMLTMLMLQGWWWMTKSQQQWRLGQWFKRW